MANLQDIVFLMIYCVIAFVVAEGLFGCWRYVNARRRTAGTADGPEVEPEPEAEAEPAEPARPLPEAPVSRPKASAPVPRRRTRSRLFRRQSRRTPTA